MKQRAVLAPTVKYILLQEQQLTSRHADHVGGFKTEQRTSGVIGGLDDPFVVAYQDAGIDPVNDIVKCILVPACLAQLPPHHQDDMDEAGDSKAECHDLQEPDTRCFGNSAFFQRGRQ